MQEDDVQALRIAVKTLEHPRLAARLAEIAGKPIELFNRALPELFPHKPLVLDQRRQQPFLD